MAAIKAPEQSQTLDNSIREAIEKNQPERLTALIAQRGVPVGENYLHAAVARDRPACIEVLVRGGFDVNRPSWMSCTTALGTAALLGRTRCIPVLVGLGATFQSASEALGEDFPNPQGYREPLLLAIIAGKLEAISTLVMLGAPIDQEVMNRQDDEIRSAVEMGLARSRAAEMYAMVAALLEGVRTT